MSSPNTGPNTKPPCAPRRIILLKDDKDSEPELVLAEYSGTAVSGTRLHQELIRLALAHKERLLAAEWHGPLGWSRFLWYRRD